MQHEQNPPLQQPNTEAEQLTAQQRQHDEQRRAAVRQVVVGTGAIAGTIALTTMPSHLFWGMDDNGKPNIPAPDSPPAPAATAQACQVNDSMTFEEAFAQARQELGPGGAFVWHGQVYGTYYQNEWAALSPEQQHGFVANTLHIEVPTIQPTDIDDLPASAATTQPTDNTTATASTTTPAQPAATDDTITATQPADEGTNTHAQLAFADAAQVEVKPAGSADSPEIYEIDLDGTGTINAQAINLDEDEAIEAIIQDTNNDGRPDIIIVDSDDDGQLDLVLVDTDFDGKEDEVRVLDQPIAMTIHNLPEVPEITPTTDQLASLSDHPDFSDNTDMSDWSDQI